MTFIEIRTLVRVLTFNRIWNLVKLWFGFSLNRIFRKFPVIGDPFAISIEPTTVCNLQCPECPTGLGVLNRSGGTMSDDTFHAIVNSLSKNTFYINLYLQGEPFIHPKLLSFIRIINTKRLFSVVSTNAQLITEKVAVAIVKSGLSKIIIGMDGITQESYSVYRQGGSVNKVTDALKYIHEAKKALKSHTPLISLQFIVFQHNQNEIVQLMQLKNLGANEIVLKSAQIISDNSKQVQIPSKKKLTRYVPKNGKLILKGRRYSHCWRIWSSMVYTWEGVVHPCCFDKDGLYPLGHIQEESGKSIWNSSKYSEFRSLVGQKINDIEMCKNCTEGRKWWI